jgi:hypothetical protein
MLTKKWKMVRAEKEDGSRDLVLTYINLGNRVKIIFLPSISLQKITTTK